MTNFFKVFLAGKSAQKEHNLQSGNLPEARKFSYWIGNVDSRYLKSKVKGETELESNIYNLVSVFLKN